MSSLFFFNDTATTEIYTLSLHDALPISRRGAVGLALGVLLAGAPVGDQNDDDDHRDPEHEVLVAEDRKSTRLNSSHDQISYAVFCLKKKKDDNSARARHTNTMLRDNTSL